MFPLYSAMYWQDMFSVYYCCIHLVAVPSCCPLVLLLYVLYGVRNLAQYCAGGKIEKNEMGGACGAYGGG